MANRNVDGRSSLTIAVILERIYAIAGIVDMMSCYVATHLFSI